MTSVEDLSGAAGPWAWDWGVAGGQGAKLSEEQQGGGDQDCAIAVPSFVSKPPHHGRLHCPPSPPNSVVLVRGAQTSPLPAVRRWPPIGSSLVEGASAPRAGLCPWGVCLGGE